MSLSVWLILLTTIITVVPIIKIAKQKRFGIYNCSIILIGLGILVISIIKIKKDEGADILNQKLNSNNVMKIDKLARESQMSRNDLFKIKASLDSFGFIINPNDGRLLIYDREKLKSIIFSGNSSTNVTSINQKGGQTARDITNH